MTLWTWSAPPELIVSDDGSAFIAPEFKMACADLGIAIKIAVGGLPELRGFIERIFGTLNLHLLPLLSGRPFGDVVEKGEADPQSLAALTLDDLAFCLTRWIVDAYHNTPHSGLPFMNLSILTHIAEILPRPILFIHGKNAHSPYFSEPAYEAAAKPKELMIISAPITSISMTGWARSRSTGWRHSSARILPPRLGKACLP